MKIYLASASPRRREIIEKIGIRAVIRISGADEDTTICEPSELVKQLSVRKALSVADELDASGEAKEGYCVIGADTVVALDGLILEKPADKEDAQRMLKLISGRKHQVYTGVSLVISGTESMERRIITFYEKTDVEFDVMTDEEIDSYIATGDPMDKAGAYGIQSLAAPYIKAIYGDYYNVCGLPANRLYHELKAAGVL